MKLKHGEKAVYNVIYLWQGERHRLIEDFSKHAAIEALNDMRNDGWSAWIERVK